MKKIIFTILLISVIASTIFFRVEIASFAVPEIARNFGVEVDQIVIDKIDMDKVVIDAVSLNYNNEYSDISIKGAGLNLHGDFSLEDINFLQSASVKDLRITIIEKSLSHSDDSHTIQSQLSNIPLLEIDIDTLEINYVGLSGNEFHYKGRLEVGEKFQILGVLETNFAPAIKIDTTLENKNFNILVGSESNERQLLDGDGEYFIEDDWLNLHFSGDVGLSVLNEYLIPFGVTPYFREDASTLKINLEIDLSQSIEQMLNTFSTRIELNSSAQVVAKKYNVESAKINVSSTCVANGLKSAECVIRQPQQARVSFADTPEGLKGYFSGRLTEYVVDLNPASSVTLLLEYSNELSIDIKGDVKIDLMSKDRQLISKALLSEIDLHYQNHKWKLNAGYSLNVEANNILQPMQAKKVFARSKGILTADQGMIAFRANKDDKIIALEARYDDIYLEKIEIHQLSNNVLTYDFDAHSLSSRDMRITALLKNINADQFQVNGEQWDVEIDKFRYQDVIQTLSGSVASSEQSFNYDDLSYTFNDISAKFNISGDDVDVSGVVLVDGSSQPLHYSASHDLAKSIGEGSVTVQSISLSENSILEQQISQSGFPLQLNSGRMEIEIMADWNTLSEEVNSQFNIAVHDLDGDYAQNQFKGLNSTLALANEGGWKLLKPTSIVMQQANIGVPINDINIKIKSFDYLDDKNPVIEVSEFTAGVLEGSMYSQDIAIDLNQPLNEFSIFLSSLSLEKLLALNQTKDLVASGSFDGELPLQINNGEILINNGWIKADDQGGFIKYEKVGEVLVGNENLVMVGELLEDFRYNEMSAQVNLNTDGSLFLATKLYGRSPKAEFNKQVNLNFNIEFNLWKFLESARLLTRIDQDISEQIISNQQKK